MATGRGSRLAALHSRPLVLDGHRVVLGLVRALGLAALPLWIVVLQCRLRLDVGLGLGMEPCLGQLVLVAGLCQLVPLGLLQLLVLWTVPGLERRILPASRAAAQRRSTSNTAW